MEPFFFGIIKGEQPLIRGSSASKSLVVFWFSFAIKREHIRRQCFFIKAIKSALRGIALHGKPGPANRYFFASFIRLRFSSKMRSSTVFTAASTIAFGMRVSSTLHA